ncbi:MAG: hypothetical protein MR739_05095 [Spirochaetia bacterium]|nr:hypothetical protein [Spirochaetia bacterium]
MLRKKQAIRPSLTLIRFPRFAQSSGLLRRGYYPCHSLNFLPQFTHIPTSYSN